MIRIIKATILAVILALAPLSMSFADSHPLTIFLAASGTTETGDKFDLSDLTGTFKLGIKTNLNADGTYRLLVTYRQVNIGPLAGDVKTLGVGAERYFDFNRTSGFLKNSGINLRASAQFELNQFAVTESGDFHPDNNTNGVFGIGWDKKLSLDDDGHALFSIEPFIDFTTKADRDFFTLGATLNIMP